MEMIKWIILVQQVNRQDLINEVNYIVVLIVVSFPYINAYYMCLLVMIQAND